MNVVFKLKGNKTVLFSVLSPAFIPERNDTVIIDDVKYIVLSREFKYMDRLVTVYVES